MQENLYALITERIMAKLEAGVIPWRKSWVSGPPKSLTTGREYRGINNVILKCSEFTSRYYITYKQAQKLGGQVRKGEKATPVVYWHWRTPEEIAKLQAAGKTHAAAPCYPFLAFVFNLDQVEGIERPVDDVPAGEGKGIETAEKIVNEMQQRPTIKHGASFNPCYIPALDEVWMPYTAQFEKEESYFSALFHELTHSTRAESRLNREREEEGEYRAYSFEELVAELGAAFLCGEAGIENSQTIEDSAAYLQGWLKALENDKKLIFKASTAAQKAADFILGKELQKEEAPAESVPLAA